jgi:hypothetical protein
MQDLMAMMRVALTVLALTGVHAQPPNMVFGDDPRKPVEINSELLCEVPSPPAPCTLVERTTDLTQSDTLLH